MIFAQVLESQSIVAQGNQGQEQRMTFVQVLEPQRIVIQEDLSQGEGFSSRDKVQRRKVLNVLQEEKTQNPEIEGHIYG
jgi:hypothetical protein